MIKLFLFNLDPFVINIHELETDYLYPNLNDCKTLNRLRAYVKNNLNLYKDDDYLRFLNELKIKFKLDDSDNPFFFYEFLDDFISRKAHGLSIPNELNPILDKAVKFSNKVFYF